MYRNEERPDGVARVLSLDLPENQWRALIDLEPEPIAWLRRQIRERLEDRGSAGQPVEGHRGTACASAGTP